MSFLPSIGSDNFMSAEEALKYGLIDEIVQPNDEKIRTMALPPPAAAPQIFGDVPKDAEEYEFGKLVKNIFIYLFLLGGNLKLKLLFCCRKWPNQGQGDRSQGAATGVSRISSICCLLLMIIWESESSFENSHV